MANKTAARNRPDRASVTIIVRRDDGEEPAHHGGAWKVAYADFVTALMAFFMLMWLLNATTEEQRIGLADYFAPTNLFGRSTSGSGKPFGGQTPNDTRSNVSTTGVPQVSPRIPTPQPPSTQDDDADVDDADSRTQPIINTDAPQPDSDSQGLTWPAGHKTGPATQQGQGQQALLKGGDYAAARLTPAPGPEAPAGTPDQGAVARGANTPEDAATPPAPPGTPAIVPPEAPTSSSPAASSPRADGPADALTAGTPSVGAAAAATVQAPGSKAVAQSDAQREQQALKQAGARLLDAVRRDPTLMDAVGQIIVDTVPEGLRIQAVDKERQPMFALGSAAPTGRVKELMQKVVPALADLPNSISIAGHTDSVAFRGTDKDNWDLSSERANATRRILVEAGLSEARIRSVTGNADRDLLIPAAPDDPANRRITIIVLRESTTGAPPAAGAH